MERTGGALRLGETAQLLEKGWVGDGSTVGVEDAGLTGGSKTSDSEGHGDAMVAAGIDLGAAQFSGGAACNTQPVRALFDFGAHAL
jgi:hypothetical protein